MFLNWTTAKYFAFLGKENVVSVIIFCDRNITRNYSVKGLKDYH